MTRWHDIANRDRIAVARSTLRFHEVPAEIRSVYDAYLDADIAAMHGKATEDEVDAARDRWGAAMADHSATITGNLDDHITGCLDAALAELRDAAQTEISRHYAAWANGGDGQRPDVDPRPCHYQPLAIILSQLGELRDNLGRDMMSERYARRERQREQATTS